MEKITSKGELLKGIRKIAAYYHCGTGSVQDLINKNVIPTYRIGRGRYAYTNEIDEALRDTTVK